MTEHDDAQDARAAQLGDVDMTPNNGRDFGVHEDFDEPPVATSKERAPRTLRGAAVVSARLLAGAAGLAAAAAVIAATIFLPLPSVSTEPPSVLVSPVEAEQQRVCAGPLLRLGDDTGAQATTASALGAPVVTSGARGGAMETTRALAPVSGEDTAAPIVTLALDDDEDPGLLAASQMHSVERGDFVGAAAAECVEPSDDNWLVGGATTTGRTTLLTIVNPGEVVATVDITVYSDAGATNAPGTSGIAIAPGEQRVYSVAGLAPGLSSPVVHVQSHGALVVSSLQQSTVRTLQPGGVDYVTSSAAPSVEQTIPGIVVQDHEALESAIAGEDFLDLNSALRMFVPGDTQAHALVTMVPVAENGQRTSAPPIDISVTLDPGRVTELPVSDFEAGRYVAVVTSDAPLVAGMRVATVAADGRNDFAWLPSVESVENETIVAVAEGANPVMTLHNPGDAPAEVELTADGDKIAVEIGAGDAVAVAVKAGAVYRVKGFDRLNANLGFTGDGTITAHTVSPRAPASTPIRVYP